MKPNSPLTEGNLYEYIMGRISEIEQNMKELTAVVHSNTNQPERTATNSGEGGFDRETGAIRHQFDFNTKRERDAFYAICGKLKELK